MTFFEQKHFYTYHSVVERSDLAHHQSKECGKATNYEIFNESDE